MNRLSALDAFSPAMARVGTMLFKPFRLKTWLTMGFIGLLGGGVARFGGNMNFRSPMFPPSRTPSGRMPEDPFAILQAWLHSIDVARYAHAIVIGLIIGVTIALVFLYLFCRFRFVLFDSVITQQPVVGRGWRLYASQANRYFGFWLVFRLVNFGVIALIIGVPIWHAYKNGALSGEGSLLVLLKLLASIALTAIAASIVFAVISTLMKDFIMPIMALDDLALSDAWSALWRVIASEPGAWAGYLGMKLVLTIAAALVLGIATVVALIPAVVIIGIPTGILVGVGVVIFKSGVTAVGIVLFAIAGLLAATAACCLYMLLIAPITVFFASYAFYFFGGRYPKLGALLWPQPPTPITPVPQMAGTQPVS
jgi:hypothetical protein